MARVLLVNPVIRQDDVPKHAPYGLAMLAGVIDKLGHKVQVFDANALRIPEEESRHAMEDVLLADKWDVVAIGGLITTYGYVKNFLKTCREILPDVLVVAGGGLLTSMPHEIMGLLPQIDIGVVGEGFVTFPEVLEEAGRKKRVWDKIQGIIWRDGSGRARLNSLRPLLEDLDSLPYPAWDMLPMDVYFGNSMMLAGEESMMAKRRLDIIATYGCPMRCRYCFHLGLSGELDTVKDNNGLALKITRNRKIRWHSPRYIVDLVKYARKRFDIDFVTFLDENMAALDSVTKDKWLSEFCNLWIDEGLQPGCVRDNAPHDPEKCKGIHWITTAHVAFVNRDMLRLMRRAGCSSLDYGFESFSDSVLKNMDKGATSKLNEKAIRLTQEEGIRPIPNQMFGFPDECFESIRQNINAWERLGICAEPFFVTPYPGSEWFEVYKKNIISQYNGDLESYLLDLGNATKLTAVISSNFNAVELLGLRELMIKRDIKRINEYEKIWLSHKEGTRDEKV